jgi:hypothetical protein
VIKCRAANVISQRLYKKEWGKRYLFIFSLSERFFYLRMIICEAVEPKKIVDAFGTVTVFSVVFVLGAQLALFNILEDVGIPFYR